MDEADGIGCHGRCFTAVSPRTSSMKKPVQGLPQDAQEAQGGASLP
jgi:hypothetical protein